MGGGAETAGRESNDSGPRSCPRLSRSGPSGLRSSLPVETDRELLRLTSCHGSEGEGCAGVRVRKRSLGVCVCACVDQQCGVGVRVDLDFPPSGPFHQEVECVFRLLSFTNRKWQRRRPVSAEAGLRQATASPPASPGAQPPALGKPEERHGQARRTETQAPTDPAASRRPGRFRLPVARVPRPTPQEAEEMLSPPAGTRGLIGRFQPPRFGVVCCTIRGGQHTLRKE